MSDAPQHDPDAEGEAYEAFFDRIHNDLGDMASELYRAGEAAGFKRGFATARAAFIKSVESLLDEPLPGAPKRIEGPKNITENISTPVAASVPSVAPDASIAAPKPEAAAKSPAKLLDPLPAVTFPAESVGLSLKDVRPAEENVKPQPKNWSAKWGRTAERSAEVARIVGAAEAARDVETAAAVAWHAERDATQKSAQIFHDPIQATSGETKAERRKADPATSAAHADIGRWTPARVDLVRARYGVEPDFATLLAAVNALPGPPIKKDHLYSQGNALAIHRPFVPSVGTAAERWTAERQAVIRDLYPVLTDIQDVVAAVNALPGPKITAVILGGYAGSGLRLKRPPGPDVIEAARKIAKDSAKPSAAHPPVDPPPVPLSPAADPPAQPAVEAVERFLHVEVTPIPPHPLSVMLQPPGPDGKVAAPLKVIQQWCKLKGFGHFDGSNVDRLNKFRAGRNEPPIVVDWVKH